jgi:hypothetical protein
MPDPEHATHRGRCLCGDVAFEFTGKPLWVAHCHCESCRRATSSPFTTYVGVRKDAFRLLSGTIRTYASSPGVERGFCPRCGSPVTFTGERWPDEVHLFAATLEDAATLAPRAHVNFAESLPWADLHDALPRYDGFGAGAKPAHIGPRADPAAAPAGAG